MTLLPLAVFSCGHHQEFTKISTTPGRGEQCYCRKCREYRVVKLAPAKYHIRCRSCRFRRATYGHVRLTAERDISRHLRKKPTHEVDFFDGAVREHTFRAMLTPLPEDGDDPPY